MQAARDRHGKAPGQHAGTLAPGASYPAHIHAGIEELHLLHGKLKVDDRTLYPGDFIHSEAGSVDHRVWSETGCTCFLLTSTEDVLF